MIYWLHHLLNPHCEQCRDEREEQSICKTCEVLRSQLEAANREKNQLLLMLLPKQKEEFVEPAAKPEVIRSHHVPFSVRRQMLEDESKQRAALLKRKEEEIKFVPIKDDNIVTTLKAQTVDELEKELGVTNAS